MRLAWVWPSSRVVFVSCAIERQASIAQCLACWVMLPAPGWLSRCGGCNECKSSNIDRGYRTGVHGTAPACAGARLDWCWDFGCTILMEVLIGPLWTVLILDWVNVRTVVYSIDGTVAACAGVKLD